ncbi:MAG: hypothetical protein PHV99_01985 [Candidatus Pacebacteria bacterium]|nr:hypothetical protein [Candidatus Paceibacterota bacterium]
MSPLLVPETRPSTVALFPFHARHVRAAIHEAKYHGSTLAFNLLAAALTDYLLDADDLPASKSKRVLIPIPLGRERQKGRGFNQTEEVARRALEELEMTVDVTLLTRTRETGSQVGLPREKREQNMQGAFKAVRRVDPASTYIVFDDVITTGATLQAAVLALRDAGAKHIIPLALAH